MSAAVVEGVGVAQVENAFSFSALAVICRLSELMLCSQACPRSSVSIPAEKILKGSIVKLSRRERKELLLVNCDCCCVALERVEDVVSMPKVSLSSAPSDIRNSSNSIESKRVASSLCCSIVVFMSIVVSCSGIQNVRSKNDLQKASGGIPRIFGFASRNRREKSGKNVYKVPTEKSCRVCLHVRGLLPSCSTLTGSEKQAKGCGPNSELLGSRDTRQGHQEFQTVPH